MKRSAIRWICRVLVAATAFLPFSGAYAGMISTEQAVTVRGAGTERAMVSSMLERAEVAGQLQALGVDADAARARVAAMTDEDVRALSGRVAALPAGGTSFGMAIIVGAIIAVAILYRYR